MALSLAAQIILGWLLVDRDFGVYAIAMACFHIFRVCTDGGVGLWLARLRPDEYDQRCGHAFWLAAGLSLLLAALVSVLALPIARLYGEGEIATLLWILAASLPLSALRMVLFPGLQVHLRFQSLAFIKLLSAGVRYTLLVTLALAGFGPLSFVIPIVAVTLLEDVAYYVSLRIPVWRTQFDWRESYRIYQQSRWSLAGTAAEAVSTQIDYVVLGLVASTQVVGIYFFAYQLTMQLVMLFSESLRKVILPVFARVQWGSASERRGLLLSGSFLGVGAAAGLVLLAVIAEPLEAVLWRGRWQSAVVPMQLLALVMPMYLVSLYTEMLAQSRGRFRLWSQAILSRGLFLGATALAAGLVTGGQNATDVTVWLAAAMLVGTLVESLVVLGGIELDGRLFFSRFIPPYAVAVVVAMGIMIWLVPVQPLGDLVLRTVVYAVGVAAAYWVLLPRAVHEVGSLTLSLRSHR